MNKPIRNFILGIILVSIVLILKLNREGLKIVEIHGSTMGSYYNINYLEEKGRNYQQEIDSLLALFNQSLSTYIQDSEITRFNKGDSNEFYFESPFFYPVISKSKEVYRNTGGVFNPTVALLVDAWGFGPSEASQLDSTKVDSLLQYVNLDYIVTDKRRIKRLKEGVQLDFGAIAKGYGVDIVADFLKAHAIENLLVEIGGEVVAYGKNENKEPWRIGINTPQENTSDRKIEAIVRLENRAIATSGNYENFYYKDGKKYVHIIDPATGYPTNSDLRAASVIANDCMTADAYATAMMVGGVSFAKKLVEEQDEIEAFLLYEKEYK